MELQTVKLKHRRRDILRFFFSVATADCSMLKMKFGYLWNHICCATHTMNTRYESRVEGARINRNLISLPDEKWSVRLSIKLNYYLANGMGTGTCDKLISEHFCVDFHECKLQCRTEVCAVSGLLLALGLTPEQKFILSIFDRASNPFFFLSVSGVKLNTLHFFCAELSSFDTRRE